MACLSELPVLNFIPLSEWDFPTLELGFVPILWTTGSYDPLAQGGNPWYGLVVPDKVTWSGASVEIVYFSGAHQYAGCYVSFPPTIVRLSFHCSGGIHQFHLEVRSGNRVYTRNMWNIPGDWILYNSNVRFKPSASRCFEKYFPTAKVLEIDLRTLVSWLELVRDYAVSGEGVSANWFNYVLDNESDDQIGLTEQCSGCLYGLTPDWAELSVDFLSTVYNSEKNRGAQDFIGFPIPELDVNLVMRLCNNKSMIVIKPDFSYSIYRELQFECGEYDTVIIRGTGLLSPQCIEGDDPDDDLPDEDDPRWVNEPLPVYSCSLQVARYMPVSSIFEGNIPSDGVYDGWITIPAVPNEPFVYTRQEYDNDGHVALVVQNALFKGFEYRQNGSVKTTVVKTLGALTTGYSVNWPFGSNPGESQAAVEARQAFYDATEAFKMGMTCDSTFDGPGSPGPLPIIERPIEKRRNLDGKCFVKGRISIGIKYDVEFVRVFRKIGPEVQEWTIRQGVGFMIPTSIKIPFLFQLPQGEVSLGGTSISVTGTFVDVTIGSEVVTINIEEIFAVYNFIEQSGILGLIAPGPIQIENLESFCEL